MPVVSAVRAGGLRRSPAFLFRFLTAHDGFLSSLLEGSICGYPGTGRAVAGATARFVRWAVSSQPALLWQGSTSAARPNRAFQ